MDWSPWTAPKAIVIPHLVWFFVLFCYGIVNSEYQQVCLWLLHNYPEFSSLKQFLKIRSPWGCQGRQPCLQTALYGSLTLLTGGFCCSSHRPLHWLTHLSSKHYICFPEQVIQWTVKSVPKTKTVVFQNLILEVTYSCFCLMLLVTQTNCDTVWKGNGLWVWIPRGKCIWVTILGWLPYTT